MPIYNRDNVSIEALVEGTGPLVVMIASLGRPAQDFDALSQSIAHAGFTSVRVQPRGIGKSEGQMTGVSLKDLATDIANVIDGMGGFQPVLIGHAFGQRVGRMLATLRPDLVKAIVMLAAGGKVPAPASALEALAGCFDLTLPEKAHLEHIGRAFFAPGNDPKVWRSGWYPEVAKMQKATTIGLDREGSGPTQFESQIASGVDAWWAAGTAPLLVIQGLRDAIALPENGRLLKQEFGKRVQLIEIERAGHALLPEQPEIIAAHVLSFLRRLHQVEG